MKKLVGLLVLLVISSLSADVLSGKTSDKGKWAVFYENGSQTIAGNDNTKFQVNSVDTVGFTYGLNDKWSVGFESTMLGINNMPGVKDSKTSWQNEGGLPGSLLVEYAILKSKQVDFKVKLKQLMTTRKLVIDKSELPSGLKMLRIIQDEDAEIMINDTYLMFIISKAVTSKLNIAGSMDFCSLKYEANDGVASAMINDSNKNFIRWAIGLDYCLVPDFIVYLYSAYAMNSSAVGSHDEDVNTLFFDDQVLADNYGVFQVGMKYLF